MIVTNKYTGRDVTHEYLALLEGLITKQEFELITMTIKWIKADKTWSTTSPHSEITWSTLDAEMARIQTEYDGVGAIQRKREKEYPSIQDQLDMQYWDKENDTTTWADAIAKVKTENPK